MAKKVKKLACASCGGAKKMPKYSNNPRTEQGRILKKGGSTRSLKKAQDGRIVQPKRGQSLSSDPIVRSKQIADMKQQVQNTPKPTGPFAVGDTTGASNRPIPAGSVDFVNALAARQKKKGGVIKKKSTSNPLKTFNDNKTMAYKKAGGTMKTFKKSLPKAQTGQGKAKPLTIYGPESKYDVDTTGYAKRENNYYPYVRTIGSGAMLKGVFDRRDMNTLMSNPSVKAIIAVGKAKAAVEKKKAAALKNKNKK